MKRLLVVLFRTLGDICIGTSVVHALKQKYPDSTIDFVTMPQNKNILEGNPDINKIVIIDNYYDANMYFIDNEYDEIYRLNMITPFDSMWHHDPSQNKQHLMDWYAKRAGIDKLEDKNIYIYLNDEDIDAVNDYWEDLDKDKKYVAIHTTSGSHMGQQHVDSKDWHIERFNDVAAMLSSLGYGIIQVGAFNDKKVKNAIDFTGKFSFKQNAEVIKRCEAFIGVDSGPAYLAGWTGKPTILIMGATQNTRDNSGPSVGPRNDNVYYLNAPKPSNSNCQPVPCYVNCQIGKIGGCISDITVTQVLNKFQEVVK